MTRRVLSSFSLFNRDNEARSILFLPGLLITTRRVLSSFSWVNAGLGGPVRVSSLPVSLLVDNSSMLD